MKINKETLLTEKEAELRSLLLDSLTVNDFKKNREKENKFMKLLEDTINEYIFDYIDTNVNVTKTEEFTVENVQELSIGIYMEIYSFVSGRIKLDDLLTKVIRAYVSKLVEITEDSKGIKFEMGNFSLTKVDDLNNDLSFEFNLTNRVAIVQ